MDYFGLTMSQMPMMGVKEWFDIYGMGSHEDFDPFGVGGLDDFRDVFLAAGVVEEVFDIVNDAVGDMDVVDPFLGGQVDGFHDLVHVVVVDEPHPVFQDIGSGSTL